VITRMAIQALTGELCASCSQSCWRATRQA